MQSCHITAEADFVNGNISFCTKEDNNPAAYFNDSSHLILFSFIFIYFLNSCLSHTPNWGPGPQPSHVP